MQAIAKISSVIVRTHCYVPRNEVDVDALTEASTVYRKYEGPPVVAADISGAGMFGIPRADFFNRMEAEEVIDLRAEGSTSYFSMRKTLFPEQEEVLGSFSRGVKAGTSDFLLKAPPGWGKTLVLTSMASALARTTLVVVPRSNLVPQWRDALMENTSLTNGQIGTVSGRTVDWIGKKVVVALVHTVALDRYGAEFKEYFGTVLFDEVDRSVPPETFAPVVGMFPAKFRIGASAELKRQDGLHKVFELHMGGMTLVGKEVNRLAPKVLVVTFKESSGFVYPKSARMNRRGMILSRLATNTKRNRILCKFISLIESSGRRVLVTSDRKEQLKTLMGMLLLHGFKYKDLGVYVSETPEKDKIRIASDCKVILATYGMMAVGIDIPDLGGLVYATPQSRVVQPKGRIERAFPGKKQPVIVDIFDTFYADTFGWNRSRLAQYKKDGLLVKYYRR